MTKLDWKSKAIMEPDWFEAKTPVGVLQIYPTWDGTEFCLLKQGRQGEDGICKQGYEQFRGKSVAECIAYAEALCNGG